MSIKGIENSINHIFFVFHIKTLSILVRVTLSWTASEPPLGRLFDYNIVFRVREQPDGVSEVSPSYNELGTFLSLTSTFFSIFNWNYLVLQLLSISNEIKIFIFS